MKKSQIELNKRKKIGRWNKKLFDIVIKLDPTGELQKFSTRLFA
jgi:hypothetical protein